MKLLIICAIFIFALHGCGSYEPEAPAEAADEGAGENGLISFVLGGASEYTLVRPDGAHADVISAASRLRSAIADQTGASLAIATDLISRRADPADMPEHEILVGETNRAETQAVLQEIGLYDFAVRVIGGKLVIVGGNRHATVAAVDYFIGNMLEGADLLLCADFSYVRAGGPGILREFANPIWEVGDDPWVILHEGYYYLVRSAMGGIVTARMENIFEMSEAELVLVWTPPPGTDHSRDLWAPELHYIDGYFYIYVAATCGDPANRRMHVLRGSYPLEPFEYLAKISCPLDRWAIDGSVMHLGGRMYFIWSGWEHDMPYRPGIMQHIYIAEMSDPWTISSDRVRIAVPDQPWERRGAGLLEGPTALERGGVMHIVYSASGSWTDYYCKGILTLVGDDPMDPASWHKHQEPILRAGNRVFGPGHGSFTTCPCGGQTWLVYHANLISGSGWGGRTTFMQPVAWGENNFPIIGDGRPPAPGEYLVKHLNPIHGYR